MLTFQLAVQVCEWKYFSDLTATNAGAEITYQCGPGFQPQNISTAVCGSNGLWSPDPALHDCTG